MSDIDHLHEAAQHTAVTPTTVDHHLNRAQAHALIAIAEELRKINNPPVTVAHYDIYANDPYAFEEGIVTKGEARKNLGL